MIATQVQRLEAENEKLKAQIRALERDWADDKRKPKACAYCKYYIRHYAKCYGRFMELYTGHCTRCRRCKDKNGNDSCKYFELGRYED